MNKKALWLDIRYWTGRLAAPLLLLLVSNSGSFALDLPPPVSDYLANNSLTEDERLPRLDSDGKAFIEYVVANRVQILSDFGHVGKTPAQQKLLLVAMEFAPGPDYLATLQRISDLKATNSLSEEVFEFAIGGTAVRPGFLSFNYQNSAVRALIERARTLVPADSDFQKYLSAILDGSQKVTDSEYIELEGLPQPDILPDH